MKLTNYGHVIVLDNLPAYKERSFLAPYSALCLDLDGTVRHSRKGRFITDPDDVVLYPGVPERLAHYPREASWLRFAVSNQGGVAYGYKDAEQVVAEAEATAALFDENPFDVMVFALAMPYGKVEKLNFDSLFRKPGYGMLALCEAVAYQHGYIVSWEHSVMVGDRDEDRVMAENVGVIAFEDAETWRKQS